jgi:hypothetical protein
VEGKAKQDALDALLEPTSPGGQGQGQEEGPQPLPSTGFKLADVVGGKFSSQAHNNLIERVHIIV